VSCARIREMTVPQTHCGVCSQCVDRRFAVLAARLEAHDPETLYKLDLLLVALPAGKLEQWLKHTCERPVTSNG